MAHQNIQSVLSFKNRIFVNSVIIITIVLCIRDKTFCPRYQVVEHPVAGSDIHSLVQQASGAYLELTPILQRIIAVFLS